MKYSDKRKRSFHQHFSQRLPQRRLGERNDKTGHYRSKLKHVSKKVRRRENSFRLRILAASSIRICSMSCYRQQSRPAQMRYGSRQHPRRPREEKKQLLFLSLLYDGGSPLIGMKRVRGRLNSLRANSDLSQTSHCNIKGLSVSELMRIENVITKVKPY